MIPELGHFLLWLALGVSVVLGTLPMIGAARGRNDWMALARPATWWLFGLVALSYGCLTWVFVQSDFSVLNVANNSNSALTCLGSILSARSTYFIGSPARPPFFTASASA